MLLDKPCHEMCVCSCMFYSGSMPSTGIKLQQQFLQRHAVSQTPLERSLSMQSHCNAQPTKPRSILCSLTCTILQATLHAMLLPLLYTTAYSATQQTTHKPTNPHSDCTSTVITSSTLHYN
jgi:hypothetical protein